jgi:hypothetical protein
VPGIASPREQLVADWEDRHHCSLMPDLVSGLLAAEPVMAWRGEHSSRPAVDCGHTVATIWPQLQLTHVGYRDVFQQLEPLSAP